MKLKMIDFAKKLELDEESLSWITAGSFSMRPVYHRQSNKLEVQLHVEKVLPYTIYHRLLSRMRTYLKVKLDLHIQADDPKASIMDLLDYLQHFASLHAHARIYTEIMPSIVDEQIVYQVQSEAVKNELDAQLPALKEYLSQAGIGMEILTEVKNGVENIPAVKCNASAVKPAPQQTQVSNDQGKKFRRRKTDVKDYVFVDIRDLQDGMSNIKIRGHIFQSEITTFKNGKCLQTLYISDDDDAVVMKRFERGAMDRSALEEIGEGDYVEAYGNAVMDSFLSDLVFMPSQIDKIEVPKRETRRMKSVSSCMCIRIFRKWTASAIFRSSSKPRMHGAWMPLPARIIWSFRLFLKRSQRLRPLIRTEKNR